MASPTTTKVTDNQMESEVAMGYTMTQICDRFIEFFMHEKPETKDWRKVLVFREEWQRYRPHFYKRCQVRIDVETDTSVKQKLIVLARKVKKVCSFNRAKIVFIILARKVKTVCSFFNRAKVVFLFFARAKIVFMAGLNYEPTMFLFDLCMHPCQFKSALKKHYIPRDNCLAINFGNIIYLDYIMILLGRCAIVNQEKRSCAL